MKERIQKYMGDNLRRYPGSEDGQRIARKRRLEESSDSQHSTFEERRRRYYPFDSTAGSSQQQANPDVSRREAFLADRGKLPDYLHTSARGQLGSLSRRSPSVDLRAEAHLLWTLSGSIKEYAKNPQSSTYTIEIARDAYDTLERAYKGIKIKDDDIIFGEIIRDHCKILRLPFALDTSTPEAPLQQTSKHSDVPTSQSTRPEGDTISKEQFLEKNILSQHINDESLKYLRERIRVSVSAKTKSSLVHLMGRCKILDEYANQSKHDYNIAQTALNEGRNYSVSRMRVEVAVFVELHVLRFLQGNRFSREKRARKSCPTETLTPLVIWV
jgi:hypothetical protein